MMPEKIIYSKSKVIDYIWQYSKYHGNLFINCENLYKEKNWYACTILLFNLIENIFKDTICDYESGFHDIIKKLKKRLFINDIEYTFLNAPKNSIRNLRNILAHSNIAKYNLVYIEEWKEILYPITENESLLKLYEEISDVLFNLILRILSSNFISPIDINLNKLIQGIKLVIKEISPEEILKFKGYDSWYLDWLNLSEDQKYRLAENASDVNICQQIFKHIKYN